MYLTCPKIDVSKSLLLLMITDTRDESAINR